MVKSREQLGQEVRKIWLEWARQQSNPKPSWLVEWDELDEDQKEVDRRIGKRLYYLGQNDCTRSYVRSLYR
jgi:hypothetical protein